MYGKLDLESIIDGIWTQVYDTTIHFTLPNKLPKETTYYREWLFTRPIKP